MDIHKSFQQGALKLAQAEGKYTSLHKQHGIEEHHWKLLTSHEYWSPDEARQVRSILASVVEVSMTIAGLPAIPLPGQYVAAAIAHIVSPCNQVVACYKVPDTFDAEAASGMLRTHEVKPMPREQMIALVMAYSGGFVGEPAPHRLPKDIEETVRRENEKS